MQMAVPEVMDIRQEPETIRELYGAKPGAASFANNCLLARRLVERGVRYVQLYDWGWDMPRHRRRRRHRQRTCRRSASEIDRPDRGAARRT